MKAPIDTKAEFTFIKRAKSLAHASRGLILFLKTTPNAWIQILIGVGAIGLGVYFNITATEWMFLVISCGFVFVAEAFNTAIEIDIDLTSPQQHPYARDTKDVAAGAVLLTALTAGVVGVFIFVPYIV